jgi:uncharacterized protein with PQ loop repeat
MSELIGLTGASLAGYAYLPQITHLIRERCSAGISRNAFAIWLLASVLMTVHAILLPALVFIVLGAIQIAAIITILIYSTRYRGLVCPIHAMNPAHDASAGTPHGPRRLRMGENTHGQHGSREGPSGHAQSSTP